MQHSSYLFLLIVFSILMLEKLSDAKTIMNGEYFNDLLQEESGMSSEKLLKRLRRRQTVCQGPYQVLNSAGGCVWSCGEGSQPGDTGNECVCQSGYYQTGTDSFGRRTCQICPSPYHVLTSDGRCVWSCSEGTEPDNNSNECICQSGYYQTGSDTFGRRICQICPTPYHVLSNDGRCVWSCGEGTQPGDNSNECICQKGYYQTGIDSFGRRICQICLKPYHVLDTDGRCVWSCAEGTESDRTSNKCVCQKGYTQTSIDKSGRIICSARFSKT